MEMDELLRLLRSLHREHLVRPLDRRDAEMLRQRFEIQETED